MTFKLNPFQEKVLSSGSRITILTAEPGAGLTTALLLKGIQDSLEFKKPFVIFVASYHGNNFADFYAKSILQYYPEVKVSNKSNIITVKVGKKKVKIKCVADASSLLSQYVPVFCIDGSRTGNLLTLSLMSGKLNIGGNGSYFRDNNQLTWIKNLESHQKWLIGVVKGDTKDNLKNLGAAYCQALQELPESYPIFDNSFTLKD